MGFSTAERGNCGMGAMPRLNGSGFGFEDSVAFAEQETVVGWDLDCTMLLHLIYGYQICGGR